MFIIGKGVLFNLGFPEQGKAVAVECRQHSARSLSQPLERLLGGTWYTEASNLGNGSTPNPVWKGGDQRKSELDFDYPRGSHIRSKTRGGL